MQLVEYIYRKKIITYKLLINTKIKSEQTCAPFDHKPSVVHFKINVGHCGERSLSNYILFDGLYI